MSYLDLQSLALELTYSYVELTSFAHMFALCCSSVDEMNCTALDLHPASFIQTLASVLSNCSFLHLVILFSSADSLRRSSLWMSMYRLNLSQCNFLKPSAFHHDTTSSSVWRILPCKAHPKHVSQVANQLHGL